MTHRCCFCGHTSTLIHVHGHYQCSVCGTNAMPCCDGDNCDTNLLFRQSEMTNCALQEPGDNTLENSRKATQD